MPLAALFATPGANAASPAASPAAAAPSIAAPGAPLGYFLESAGPAADPTRYLGWALAALCVVVCIVVAGLLLAGLLRRRPGARQIAPEALTINGQGLNWLFIGSGISTLALLAALVYALVTLQGVAAPPGKPALSITVTAYDWWWRIEYREGGADAGPRVVTANEIHIPVGEPVLIELESADVIHAFWVPLLAGKTQAIPGQTNRQWIQADRPGIYRGQCSLYCGAQHAHMAFEVVAQSPAEFAAWRRAQAAPRPPAAATSPAAAASGAAAGQTATRAGIVSAPTSGTISGTPDAGILVHRGETLFDERCAGCHTVRGTSAAGIHAPDLTHLGSRRLIAAGMLANTGANLLDWIEHAQRIKPGSAMPSIALSADDAHSLSAYLATLD